MVEHLADLSALAGRGRGNAAPEVDVPRPRARWRTRVLVPAAILLAAGGLLAYAAREALWPGVDVRVVPVVVRANGSSAAADVRAVHAATGPAVPGPVVAQAPGWVEPDPYAIAVSAL